MRNQAFRAVLKALGILLLTCAVAPVALWAGWVGQTAAYYMALVLGVLAWTYVFFRVLVCEK